MKRVLYVKEKDDKLIPKYSKAIADRYIKEAGNIFSRFEQLERNKLYLQKIRTNSIDQGILLFDNHKAQEKLERRHQLLLEFTTPQIVHGKKVWNLGGGMNPFLACYMNRHKYEIKKPTWRVRKCLT